MSLLGSCSECSRPMIIRLTTRVPPVCQACSEKQNNVVEEKETEDED
jgi:hypothetical protein